MHHNFEASHHSDLELQRSSAVNELGFSFDDVLESALATGLVIQQDECILIQSGVDVAEFARLISEMQSYFDAPGEPNSELLRIQNVVSEYMDFNGHEDMEISSWACAWLDLQVRADLADRARSDPELWSHDALSLDLVELREHRIEQIRLRDGQPSQSGFKRKIAPSSRHRGQSRREARTG